MFGKAWQRVKDEWNGPLKPWHVMVLTAVGVGVVATIAHNTPVTVVKEEYAENPGDDPLGTTSLRRTIHNIHDRLDALEVELALKD